MQTFISLLLIVLSIVGIADAGYISYEEANNIIPPCGEGFDCEAVLTSKYARIGPVPLANIGLVYYILMFVLALLQYLDINLQQVSFFKNSNRLKRVTPTDFLLLLSALGFLFSLYLVGLMGIILQAWCKYCLISAATSAALFAVTQIYHSKYTGHSAFLAKAMTLQIIRWLYQIFGKPLFFLTDPELVHNFITKLGALMGEIPIKRFFTRWVLQFRHPVLTQKFNGITFPNPVGLSAGYDYDGDLTQILPDVGFGFQTIGTVTYEPYAGNPKPRLGRFPNSKALLVNKGLKSIGATAIIRKLSNREFRIPVGISIGSTNKHYDTDADQVMDILKCFLAFEKSQLRHSYYELNISCPNTFGGEPFTQPDRLEVLLTALDELNISRPVYVKFPIDQSEKESIELLDVIAEHNTQGVIIGNLTKDRENPDVLPEDRASWRTKRGNLSGKPTFARSNAIIELTRNKYGKRFTIIGTGGVFTTEDAIVKLEKGADLVQLITGMIFEGPPAIGLINHGLANYLLDKRTK